MRQDRASCSALVAALLQRCFDLTPLVFREQISLFCSRQGRLCDLTRWKMHSRGEGSQFSSCLNSLFFPFSVVTSRHTLYCGLLLVEMHIYLSTTDLFLYLLWFCCCWRWHCYRTFRICKLWSLTVWALIQLSLVSFEGKGIGLTVWLTVHAHVCLYRRCLWVTERSASVVEPLLDRDFTTDADTVVLGPQHINLLVGCWWNVEAGLMKDDVLV